MAPLAPATGPAGYSSIPRSSSAAASSRPARSSPRPATSRTLPPATAPHAATFAADPPGPSRTAPATSPPRASAGASTATSTIRSPTQTSRGGALNRGRPRSGCRRRGGRGGWRGGSPRGGAGGRVRPWLGPGVPGRPGRWGGTRPGGPRPGRRGCGCAGRGGRRRPASRPGRRSRAPILASASRAGRVPWTRTEGWLPPVRSWSSWAVHSTSARPPGPSLRWSLGSAPAGRRSDSTRAFMRRTSATVAASRGSRYTRASASAQNRPASSLSPATGRTLIRAWRSHGWAQRSQ